jgi:hypothetical protein
VTELWTTDTLSHIEAARQRAAVLTGLASVFLPRTFESSGDPADWPLVGFAMLSRASGTLSSVMALIPARRSADAAVLARTLYEEIVTFAWIVIQPSTNAPAWVRWDRCQRIKYDNDMRNLGAPAMLEAQVRARFEAAIAAGPGMPIGPSTYRPLPPIRLTTCPSARCTATSTASNPSTPTQRLPH